MKRAVYVLFFFVFIGVGLGSASFTFAIRAGQDARFYVESEYDAKNREELRASYITASPHLYVYVEEEWWESKNEQEQKDLRRSLDQLADEFEDDIYPELRNVFGEEPYLGVDGDRHITLLFHEFRDEGGGYFNAGNLLSRYQYPRSNRREMVSLNTEFIGTPLAKSLLAHEFFHLIAYNQKTKTHGAREERWLSEALAEYAPTLLGYDRAQQEETNLQRRVRDFLGNTNDSLLEWENTLEDYASSNLFVQYLADHYGEDVLVDILHMEQTGIASINQALRQSGFDARFEQIFEDWIITLLVNDCQAGSRYCYKNQNLRDVRVVPTTHVLPSSESTLSAVYGVKEWEGSWFKVVGGNETVNLEFQNDSGAAFRVPYVLKQVDGSMRVEFFEVPPHGNEKLTLSSFEDRYKSVTVLPLAQTARTEARGEYSSFRFVLLLSSSAREAQDDIPQETSATQTLRERLLARVAALEAQLAELQARFASLQNR